MPSKFARLSYVLLYVRITAYKNRDFEQDVKHACGPDTSGASSRGTGMSYGAAAVAALALAGATFVK
jgi:hypothetical protein